MRRIFQLRYFWILALVVGAGGLAYFKTRPFKSETPNASLPEAHRTNLVLSAGLWRVPGQSNGFTGLLLDTYDDGARKSRSAISNGQLHGVSFGWHTNGRPQVEEHFVAGTSHGVRTKWHANGQRLSEVPIENGKLHGTFRRWDEHGARAEEVEMKDGQPDGLSRAWYSSGFLKAEATLRAGRVVEQHSWKDGERPSGG